MEKYLHFFIIKFKYKGSIFSAIRGNNHMYSLSTISDFNNK